MRAVQIRFYLPQTGFTLVEMIMVVVIFGLLMAFAAPTYKSYINDARAAQAIGDMGAITLALKKYRLNNAGRYPQNLAEAGADDRLDPWGEPYEYQRLEGEGRRLSGLARKDKNLNPINTDFDLYSKGEDRSSAPALTAAQSRDDIVRAGNGNFFGFAEDY